MKTHSTSAVTVPPRRVHRRIEHRLPRRCARCNWWFTPAQSHPNYRYCSHRCRTLAYRRRQAHWALITWDGEGEYHAHFRYFATPAEAHAAAPADEPFTVIDAAMPAKPSMTVEALIKATTRPVMEVPYPNKAKPRLWR